MQHAGAHGDVRAPINHDADLIRLCDRLVAITAEEEALVRTDPFAPDGGPNHPHFEELWDERERVVVAIEEAGRPATAAGAKALARAALNLAFRDDDDKPIALNHGHRMQLTLTQWIAEAAA